MHACVVFKRHTFELVTDQGTNRYELFPFTLERRIIYFSTVKTATKKIKIISCGGKSEGLLSHSDHESNINI